MLTRQVAQERDTSTALALAVWGGVYVLVTAAAFDLAQAELDSATVPTNRPELMKLADMLAAQRSIGHQPAPK